MASIPALPVACPDCDTEFELTARIETHVESDGSLKGRLILDSDRFHAHAAEHRTDAR